MAEALDAQAFAVDSIAPTHRKGPSGAKFLDTRIHAAWLTASKNEITNTLQPY